MTTKLGTNTVVSKKNTRSDTEYNIDKNQHPHCMSVQCSHNIRY